MYEELSAFAYRGRRGGGLGRWCMWVRLPLLLLLLLPMGRQLLHVLDDAGQGLLLLLLQLGGGAAAAAAHAQHVGVGALAGGGCALLLPLGIWVWRQHLWDPGGGIAEAGWQGGEGGISGSGEHDESKRSGPNV